MDLGVTQITIVTDEATTVVMDVEIAQLVRAVRRGSPAPLSAPVAVGERIPQRVFDLVEDAHRGNLFGKVLPAEGRLHFRPDGYQFLVPIAGQGVENLFPGRHYRVAGRITTRDGQPDIIFVESATPAQP